MSWYGLKKLTKNHYTDLSNVLSVIDTFKAWEHSIGTTWDIMEECD